MHSMKIEVVAITEFHEPKPYEHFAALQIDVYEMSGGNPNATTLLIHRCEDILGIASSEDKGTVLVAAREYLDNNYKPLIQSIISEFGE